MRLHARQRSGKRGQQGAGRAGLALVGIAFIGGLCWIGWKERWFRPFKRPQAPAVADTNAPAAKAAPTNAPVAALTNRPVVRQVPAVPPAPPVTNQPPAAGPTNVASKTAAVLDAQIALDRIAISCGSLDGVLGSQTRAALRAFQSREHLPATGELDTNTRTRLTLSSPALAPYTVSAADFDGLHPVATTWLGKSQQERLGYETILEAVAEKAHSHPSLIKRLNSSVDWANALPGMQIMVPSVDREPPPGKAAFVRINLAARTLQAYDWNDRLLAHFPCSIAQRVEKRPIGELRVAVTAPNPNYTFDPDVFPESAEARELGRKLVLPPGPNNPVGAVWIGLDKPGYGIHGTPRPEEVGRTESHGCFRLANWNAEYLLKLVAVGTPIYVVP